jgi:diacylglycerol kinase
MQFFLPMPDSYLTGRLRSFAHAFRGIATLLGTQPNARIHALATIAVVAVGMLFRLSLAEWTLIALAILCVWMAEALNTSIEFLVDLASPEVHPLAGKAKDVAAAAVLIAASGSVVVGALVFAPHVLRVLGP